MEKEESLFNAVSCGELFIVKDTPCKWWISCNICKNKFENLEHFLNHIINSHLNKELDDTLQARTEHCSIENTNTISIEDKVFAVAPSTRSNCNGENNKNVGRNNESNIEIELDNKTIRAIENNESDIENELGNTNAEISESNESDIENELDNKNPETIASNESDIENEARNTNTRIIENNDSEFNIVAKSLTDLDLKFENSNQKLEASIDKKGERHQCPHCERNYASRKSLLKHIKTHFELKQLLKCEECGATLSSKKTLKLHMRLHTGERPEKCNICSKAFRQRSALDVHLTIHTGKKRFSCSFCEKTFRIKVQKEFHERVHKDEKPAICDICGDTFRSNGALKTHSKMHHEINAGKTFRIRGPLKHPRLGKSNKNSLLKLNPLGERQEKKFQCRICPTFLSSPAGVRIHERTHIASKKYRCEICFNNFRTYANIGYHMIKEHKCKAIPQKNYTLQKHEDGMVDEFLPVKPKEEKPFVCKTCGTKYANQKCLKMHERFHAKTKDYKCDTCDECFRTYADINYHMRKEHNCLAKANSNYTLNGGKRRK